MSTTRTVTLLQLSAELDERNASMQIHYGLCEWTVCLYASDDPAAAWFRESSDDLITAVNRVLAAWDGKDQTK